eukprot:52673_1
MKTKGNMVYGIGSNPYGEFGNGNTTSLNALKPLKFSNDDNITHIYNGCYFTIYRSDSNVLYASGDNRYGSCMQDKNSGNKILSLTAIKGLQNINISKVYCNPISNSYHGFIVSTDQKLYGFGRNNNGQLGINNNTDQYKPIYIHWSYGMIKEIQCSQYDTIILTQNGSVYWSGNGQVIGNNNSSKTFKHLKELANIKSIAVGYESSLYLDNNGVVYGLGKNSYGQLGLNKKDNDKHNKPMSIRVFQERKLFIVDIAAGNYHCLAMTKGKLIFSWGYNGNGACGHGYKSNEPLTQPTQIKFFQNKEIKSIMCGSSHSAAITTANEIFLFGNNSNKECIISTYDSSKDNPVSINEFVYNKFKKNIISITLGYSNTKVIVSDNATNTKPFEEEKDVYETNNMSEYVKGEEIKCVYKLDGQTYDATIIKVENNRIFVVYKGYSEAEGEWILNNEWNSRIFTKDESEQKIQNVKSKQENKTSKTLYKTQTNDQIINELVNLGIGSKNECIAASLLVVNPNDINEITNKISELQNV